MRQPVHTVYVPADQASADTVATWGAAALDALDRHGPLPDLDDAAAERGAPTVSPGAFEAAVRAKLASEPIEDLRVDFEDGYGARPDDVEDAHARAAATALGTTPFSGIRIKALEPATHERALRTLKLVLDELGTPPLGFRVTLAKVTSAGQVAELAALGVRFEIQVETPQAVLAMTELVDAAGPRCVGLHFGTYDYTAALGIAPAQQAMDHPVADHAKAVMQVAAAAAGIPVSDGSTNVLPVGDTDTVRAAWALHARLVRRSLERGFYQGWDLHPAQLPTRFAATYAFYRDGLPAAAARLRAYRDTATAEQATGIADEPATARALAGFLLRALDCGAATDVEGFSEAELRALAAS